MHVEPLGPTFRANPFSEVTDLFCRLPLSTLFYLTRGCSPWKPDAVMRTPELENYPFLSIFMDQRERTGWHKNRATFPVLHPYLQLICFRGHHPLCGGGCDCLKEKRTLPRARAGVSRFTYVAVKYPSLRAGILTGFPFDKSEAKRVLGRQSLVSTPWLTERHGYDPTWL